MATESILKIMAGRTATRTPEPPDRLVPSASYIYKPPWFGYLASLVVLSIDHNYKNPNIADIYLEASRHSRLVAKS